MYQCGHSWHRDPCVLLSLQGLDIVSDGPGPLGLSVMEGWAGGTAATGGPVPWETADGGVHGDVYFGPRTIVIEGDIEARTHREFAELVEELGSVLTRPRRDVLTVDETYHLGLVRQVEVVRTRPPMISQAGDRHGVFTLTLEAASHLRVDVDEQSIQSVLYAGSEVENIGNAPAELTMLMHGPLTNPGLSWPGGSWQYSGTVATGQVIQVEMWRRKVVDLATAAHTRTRAQGTWLSVPPGVTTISRTGSGAGRVEFRWRSSWS